MSLFSVKLQETTLILPTLGVRYLEERCRYILFSDLENLRVMRDDINTVYPGHQVPLRVLPSRYSCSATPKTS
ncbi:hypothetical protein TSAR_015968 [Trichomalopsis sarcophagae]|uniref:Uncharacterized protein n=1 Tax=Trichomalopsis sarcophagae TaxID=543379 RepID=A0A232EL59_9HYME|nr:hypothetical protein TSAR_015968 [Trichomalopsis sarcophagae]